jgi:peptidoglycan-associated lipoprotein
VKRNFVRFGIPAMMLAISACSTQAPNESSPAAASAAQPSSAASHASGARAPSASVSAAHDVAAPGARSVYYDFDSSDIRVDGRNVIQTNAQYLREHPAVKLRIEGNADERGSAEYNLALGQRRAEGVMKAMRAGGVADERMEAVSYGKEKPAAAGHDEASWAQNRRSDIVYR